MANVSNKMLYLYVFVAVLAVGDCSLAPIIKPLMSFLEGTKGIKLPTINPTSSAYRIQSSVPSPIPSGVTMTSANRWGGLNIGNSPQDTAIPKVAFPPDTLEKRPLVQINAAPTTGSVDNDVFKYMFGPQRYHYTGRLLAAGEINPTDKMGVRDMNRGGWKLDDGEKRTVVVKPYQTAGIRNNDNRLVMYGTGEKDEQTAVERSDVGNVFWKNDWIRGDEDPGHDTDDQPDHDRHGTKKYRIKAAAPDDSDEKTRHIVIITKSAKPPSWYRGYLHSRDGHKHIHRRGLSKPLLSKNGSPDCIHCNA